MVSDTFAINSQGVISLRSDATLDREILDSYILQVQSNHIHFLNPATYKMFRMTIHSVWDACIVFLRL